MRLLKTEAFLRRLNEVAGCMVMIGGERPIGRGGSSWAQASESVSNGKKAPISALWRKGDCLGLLGKPPSALRVNCQRGKMPVRDVVEAPSRFLCQKDFLRYCRIRCFLAKSPAFRCLNHYRVGGTRLGICVLGSVLRSTGCFLARHAVGP